MTLCLFHCLLFLAGLKSMLDSKTLSLCDLIIIAIYELQHPAIVIFFNSNLETSFNLRTALKL